MTDWKKAALKAWKFIMEDDSPLSWAINIILAFVLIKFIVYPGLGLILGTTNPIVAVISDSMQHPGGFDAWWSSQEPIYNQFNVTKAEFKSFSLGNGFNKGDIIFLIGSKPQDLKVGDVIVFKSLRPDPIIHRIVTKWQAPEGIYFQTKGDHNFVSIQDGGLDEMRVSEKAVIGKALFRIPWLGYIKIWFVEVLNGIVTFVRGY